MNMIRIRTASTKTVGYAWTTDFETVCHAPNGNHHEALGILMMHLSCTEDIERCGIELELVDMVPENVVFIANEAS